MKSISGRVSATSSNSFRQVEKKGPLPKKGPLIFGGFWTKWSGREDLNLRPLAPQASALTRLRHVPTNIQTTIEVWQESS